MDMDDIIVRGRGASRDFNRGSGNGDHALVTDSLKPAQSHKKDGQFFTREDGAVCRHYFSKDDVLIIGPDIDTVPKKHRASNSERMHKMQRLKLLINMRDTVRQILDLQEEWSDESVEQNPNMDEPPWAKYQRDLLKLYNNFKDVYGPINKYELKDAGKRNKYGEQKPRRSYMNLKKFRKDPDAYLVASIENFDHETQTSEPGDIFFKRIVSARGMKKEIKNVQDAFDLCLSDKGRLDLDYIAGIFTDGPRDKDEVIAELSEKNIIFQDPETKEWQTQEDYLSGYVRDKLEIASHAAEQDLSYEVNVKALKKICPKTFKPSEIDVALGMNWIPTHVIEQFAREELGGADDVRVTYVAKLNKWWVEGSIEDDKKGNFELASEEYNALELLQIALERHLKQDGGRQAEIEKRNNAELNDYKKELIQQKFLEWLWKDASRRQDITELYNNKFQNFVPFKGDGAHLQLPGMSVAIDLRPHQKAAIWRTIKTGNMGLFHEVGAGKTFASIAAAMEMQRLGKIKKPIFEVPNHMLEQFAGDFLKLYPNANILVVKEDQFSEDGEKITAEEKKHKIVNRMREGNYDAIITTHSNSDLLKLSPKTQLQLKLEELREYRDLYEWHMDQSSSVVANDLERAYRNKKAELNWFLSSYQQHSKENSEYVEDENIDDSIDVFIDDGDFEDSVSDDKYWFEDQIDKDSDNPVWSDVLKSLEEDNPPPYFEDTNVDYSFKDEAHLYKNLRVVSRYPGVSRASSARAENFYQISQYLNKMNPGYYMTLMTATPVSNALSEIHTMMKYLQPENLKALGLEHFDAFSAMFTEMEDVLELVPETGRYQTVPRMTRYKNVAQLLRIISDFADIVLTENLDLNLPELEGKTIKPVRVDRPSSLDLFFYSLAYRAVDQRRGSYVYWNQIKESLTEEEIEEVISLAQARTRYDENGRLYKDKNGEIKTRDNIVKILTDARLATVDPRLVGIEPKEGERTKIDELVDNVFDIYQQYKDHEYFDKNGNTQPFTGTLQTVWCDLGVPKSTREFSVYDQIKTQLEHKGIPREMIRFIHDYKDDKSKEQLYEECRTGKVAVLILSKAKGGTGLNVQRLHIATHFMNVMYNDIEQPLGRLKRQGNLHEVVKAFAYLYRGASDEFMYNMVARKTYPAAQIMKGKMDASNYDFEDDLTSVLQGIAAEASDNPFALKKVEVDKKLNEIVNKKRIHGYGLKKAESEIDALSESIETDKNLLLLQKQVLTIRNSYRNDHYPVVIDNPYDENKIHKAGEELKNALRDFRFKLREQVKILDDDQGRSCAEIQMTIGTVYGFPIQVYGKVELLKRNVSGDGENEDFQTKREYKYSDLYLQIHDNYSDVIKFTKEDLRKTEDERVLIDFNKAKESKEKMSSDFKKAARSSQCDQDDLHAGMAERIVVGLRVLESKIQETENRIIQNQQRQSALKFLLDDPFPYQKEYDDLVKIKKEIDQKMLRASNDNESIADSNFDYGMSM